MDASAVIDLERVAEDSGCDVVVVLVVIWGVDLFAVWYGWVSFLPGVELSNTNLLAKLCGNIYIFGNFVHCCKVYIRIFLFLPPWV